MLHAFCMCCVHIIYPGGKLQIHLILMHARRIYVEQNGMLQNEDQWQAAVSYFFLSLGH